MNEDPVGIALFLLVLSIAATVYALLPGRKGHFIQGRVNSLRIPLNELQVVAEGRGVVRSFTAVSGTGWFKMHVPELDPVTIRITRSGRPLHCIRVSWQPGPYLSELTEQGIELGTIELDGSPRDCPHSEVRYHGPYIIHITMSEVCNTPTDHRLLERNTHWADASAG